MSNQGEGTGADRAEETVSIVAVPNHLMQQVLEYVAGLAHDETEGAEVGGYMMSGISSHLNTSLAAKSSSTNCWFWDTKLPVGGVDFQCAD